MKVLNFGSLNIDYVYSLDHFVQKGETISSERLDIFSGGKGLNQSVALGRAGAEVYHAGAIGRRIPHRASLRGWSQDGICQKA